MVYNYFKLMKFLALTALVAIVSAEACTEDELADDANCDVTTTEGEGDAAVETVTCTPVADDVECDAAEEEEEEEASTTLYASVASAAVAVTMMF